MAFANDLSIGYSFLIPSFPLPSHFLPHLSLHPLYSPFPLHLAIPPPLASFIPLSTNSPFLL